MRVLLVVVPAETAPAAHVVVEGRFRQAAA